MFVAELILHKQAQTILPGSAHVYRFWLLAGVAVLSAFGLIRRRYIRRTESPKLDEVSTDWLAYARSRSDETL